MTRFYGGQGEERNTIHATDYVDVETDQNGKVLAVWFRCSTLPFKQHLSDASLWEGSNPSLPRINGIVFEE